VSQDLAKALSGKKFLTYVEEAALKVLAQDGSARLEELSGGRYSFDVREHEFLVVDHWNADETRGVSTLSGGETFLASLGLAEALAERLPDLAVGQGRSSLESLFIDEGFGALDEQSLDGAAQALESLRAKNRLVCIITHVRQLAERMPARINVAKAEHGSAISAA
jgi:exonuclease SbcC